jgi:hypothetical protein
MSDLDPVFISDTNLSRAWAKVLVYAIDHPGTEISPLIISLTDFGGHDSIPELPAVRDALDAMLRDRNDFEVATVANTIFPQSVWRISAGDRHVLYEEYIDAFPRYAAMEPMNRHGTYFSRLIAFNLDGKTGERLAQLAGVPKNGNQLEYVIELLAEGSVRRDSAFQASIFDPTRDHSIQPYKVFPCMQHLTFIRLDGGGLGLNAFYATQQIVRKAYGNLLGLCRLGHFVASQTNLTLERVTVFVGCEKIGDMPKSDEQLAPVLAAARAALVPPSASSAAAATPSVQVRR